MATSIITKCNDGKYRVRFDTHNKDYYQFVLGAARRCEYRKTITEGDLIRAMSDKELADFFATKDTIHWLNSLSESGYTPTQNQRRVAKRGFYGKWLRYLKQEVKGD